MTRDRISPGIFRLVVCFGFGLLVYATTVAYRVGALRLLVEAFS